MAFGVQGGMKCFWLASVVRCFALAMIVCFAGGCGFLAGQDSDNWGHPSVTKRAEDDAELKVAAKQALANWATFEAAYAKSGSDGKSTFSAKFPVSDGVATEHFWMYVSSINNGSISGTFDCDGIDVTSVHKGDKHSVKVADLEDWYINQDGILKGGYSILALDKSMLAQICKYDSKSSDAAARKRELQAHWQKICAEVTAQGKEPKDSDGRVCESFTKEDSQALSVFLLMDKLMAGNAGHEPAVADLVEATSLPLEVVQSMQELYKLRKQQLDAAP